MSEATATAAEKIAGQIGEDASILKERRIDWSKAIIEGGVLVDLNIGRRRFERKMTKADLGLDQMDSLEFERFIAEFYDFGTKLLIPKSAMQVFSQIETKARTSLYQHAFRTPYGWFVPHTAYASWKEETAKFHGQYFEAAEVLVGKLPVLREEIVQEYRKAAHVFYEKTQKTESLEQFASDFVGRLEHQLPTEEDVRNTFYFRWDLSYIPIPTEVEEEMLKALEIREKQKLAHAKSAADLQVIEEERRMHLDVIAHQGRAKKEKVDSMIDSFAADLGGALFNVVRDTLEDLSKGAAMTATRIKAIEKVIKRCRLMNFMGDDSLDTAICSLESMLVEKGRASRKEMATVLHRIATDFKEFGGDDAGFIPDVRRQFLI